MAKLNQSRSVTYPARIKTLLTIIVLTMSIGGFLVDLLVNIGLRIPPNEER